MFWCADWLGFAALCGLTVAFAVVMRYLVDVTSDDDADERPNRRRDALRRGREEEQQQRDDRAFERELKNLEKEEEIYFKRQEQLKTVKAEYKQWSSQMKCKTIECVSKPTALSDSELITYLKANRISSLGELARKFRISVKSAAERLESLHKSNTLCIYIDRTGFVVIYGQEEVDNLLTVHTKRNDLARELKNLYA
jgi:hypothetical protein